MSLRPRSTLLFTLGGVLLLGMAGGCAFDADVPPGLAISCSSDKDCPADHICVEFARRCVAESQVDREDPALIGNAVVRPELVRLGGRVELSFRANEPLAEQPEVRIGEANGGIAMSFVRQGDEHDNPSFLFQRLANGSEPEESQLLYVTMVDVSGNQAERLVAGTVRFDFKPPSLVGDPAPDVAALTTDQLSELELVFDEPLVAPPVVYMQRPQGARRANYPWLMVQAVDDRRFAYRYSVDGTELAGDYDIVIQAQDLAGNLSVDTLPQAIELDFTAPELVVADIAPSRLRQGDLLRVTLTLTEPLSDAPTLVARSGQSSFELETSDPSLLILTYRQIVEGADGDYALELGEIRDRVGNRQPAKIIGQVTLDSTPPVLVDYQQNSDGQTPLAAHEILDISFATDEALSSTPVVELLNVALTPDTADPSRYRYTLPLVDTGLSGRLDVYVRMVDSVGNVAALLAGPVAVDAVLPDLSDPQGGVRFSADEVMIGTQAYLSVIANEPLSRPPLLHWATLLGDPGFSHHPLLSSQFNHTFELAVDRDVPEGVYAVEAVTLHDLAGNFQRVTLASPRTLQIFSTQCAGGYHDGGDGVTCLPDGSCLGGKHDGGDGTCVDVGTCVAGFHNGGTGGCVPLGTCADDFHDGGDGNCIEAGNCLSGYHNGGDGSCVRVGTCAVGYHDGGIGLCAPWGSCSTGYHDGGDGSCVDEGTCVSGYRDGGDGSCTLPGVCASGYHDGGDGSCLPDGTCVVGYHDGGDGSCVTLGSCVSGYHDGGDGSCLPLGSCIEEWHDGGLGSCVPFGTCSGGFHDDGEGVCVLLGNCASGYWDGGDGVCWPYGECSPGFADLGAGYCELIGLHIVGSSPVVADGQSVSTITIKLRDAGGGPISGEIPVFAATGVNEYGPCSVSDDFGVSYCTMSSDEPGDKQLALLSPYGAEGGWVFFATERFEFRKRITIHASSVIGGLLDYPMLFSEVDPDLVEAALGGGVYHPGGYDIMFTDAAGGRLRHEIELYDSVAGQLVAWVRLPALSAVQDTDLWIYYGNTSVEQAMETPDQVWDDDYQFVMHFADGVSASPSYMGSTAHAISVNCNGVEIQDCMVGKCVHYGADSGSCAFAGTLTMDRQARTHEMWLRVTGEAVRGGNNYFWNCGTSNHKNHFRMAVHHNSVNEWSVGYLGYTINGASWIETEKTTVPFGQFVHLVVTYDGSQLRWYANGEVVLETEPLDGNLFTDPAPCKFDDYGFDLVGNRDEYRASNIARSASYVATSYANQYDPDAFYELGPQEDLP